MRYNSLKPKSFSSAMLLLMAIVMQAFGVASCSEKVETITVAYAPFESTALLWIALDQNFFNQNNLQITLRKYDTGVATLDGVMNGETEISLGANEFPLVSRALHKDEIRTIGSIAKSEFIYLVGRKDRDIVNATDLKGKRIGTSLRTIAQFFLGRFLELNGMGMDDIILVDLKTPDEWVEAVARGDIDAVVIAQPYAQRATDRLGDNAVIWPVQNKRWLQTQVLATHEWINAHPDIVKRFLKSLSLAEDYAAEHPAEAKAIVQKRLNLEAAYMDVVWKQNQFLLSLDQSLVVAMEDEARWSIANHLTTATVVPNFIDYIYEDGMDAVAPEAVDIIR